MIMDKMGYVKRAARGFRTVAQELGKRLAAGPGWQADCLLCLEPSGGSGVCDNCERLLVVPGPRCLRCAIPLAGPGVCGDCLRNLPAFDEVTPAYDFRFPVDRLVRRFKFSADLAAGACLGEALARAVRASARPDLVVASPASRERLRERGFNPALVLAQDAGSRLRLPVDSRVLAKVRHTPPQAGLARAARRRNLRGAFAVRRRLDGLEVAVVDDVMTTGATLAEIAAALKGAGAARVSAWVVARTPGPPGRG
jgi:ComF family protein